MTGDYCDALWQDEHPLLPLSELAVLAGMSEREVLELVAHDVLVPAEATAGRYVFTVRSVTIARTARKLGEDYALEPHGVAVLLGYIERIRDLEGELRALRAQLPR